MVKAAAPGAVLITDTLDGTDVPVSGNVHMWTVFTAPTSGFATLSVIFKSAPASVLIDGRAISGAACRYDQPPGGSCTDVPCAQVSVFVPAGTHEIELRFGSPGVVGLAALVSHSGRVLASTNAAWYVQWDAVAAASVPSALPGSILNLPEPPATPFRLFHPQLGVPISLDASSWSPCGVAGRRSRGLLSDQEHGRRLAHRFRSSNTQCQRQSSILLRQHARHGHRSSHAHRHCIPSRACCGRRLGNLRIPRQMCRIQLRRRRNHTRTDWFASGIIIIILIDYCITATTYPSKPCATASDFDEHRLSDGLCACGRAFQTPSATLLSGWMDRMSRALG